jgi:hypothetical protein
MHPGIDQFARWHEESRALVFAVTDDDGELVAVHRVFLGQDSRETGRDTVGDGKSGYVRFPGKGPAIVVVGEPEHGWKLWQDTGFETEVWVDVSGWPERKED